MQGTQGENQGMAGETPTTGEGQGERDGNGLVNTAAAIERLTTAIMRLADGQAAMAEAVMSLAIAVADDGRAADDEDSEPFRYDMAGRKIL